MNTAEWILVVILSVTLFAFLIVGIVALTKWNDLVGEAKKVIVKSQDVVETANNIAENVKGITSVGRAIQRFSDRVAPDPDSKKSKSK